MFIIGERINPAGKRDLAGAIRQGKKTLIQQQAIAQERAGAQALDINVFVPDVERTQAMRIAVESVRAVSRLPLVIDDTDPEVVGVGMRQAVPSAWINSPLDVDHDPRKIFSLAREFDCEMLVLPMRQNQIPQDLKERLAISRLVLKQLEGAGIARERVVLDAVVLALRQAREKVMESLEAIKWIKGELGVRTVIGLSNLSYRLRNREQVNARFLVLAKGAGVDLVICDPLQKEVMRVAKDDVDGSAKPVNQECKKFLEFAETCWI